MADSGNPVRNYALRGKVKDLYEEYRTPEKLHEALCKGTNDLWGDKVSSDNVDQSAPHFQFLKELNKNERLKGLDVVFEYVIPGTTLRADAVIIGKRKEKNYALILEIKSWKESKWGTSGGFVSKYNSWHINASGHLTATPRKDASGKDETTAGGTRLHEIKHPLYQALTYRNLITLFHDKASHTDKWKVHSACFIPGITDYSFLFLGEATGFFSQKNGKGSDDNKASFIYNNPEEIGKALEDVCANKDACDVFLAGSFAIPRGEGRGPRNVRVIKPLHEICVAIAGTSESAGIDLRNCILMGMLKQIEQSKAHSSCKDKTVIVANIQRLLDYRARDGVPLFVNAADIALLLQDSLLRNNRLAEVFGDDGLAEVSVQTSTEYLLDLKTLLQNDGKLSNASERVVHAFDEINLEHPGYFNVFSAYKWSNAVCTPMGIIDLCGGSRAQARDKEKLTSFLKSSAEARVIFLLVDDGTKSVKDLNDGESTQGFTIVKWPTD